MLVHLDAEEKGDEEAREHGQEDAKACKKKECEMLVFRGKLVW